MIRRLIVPLGVAIVAFQAGEGFAQGAFPAPLPGQPQSGNVKAPLTGLSVEHTLAPSLQAGRVDECKAGFAPLRDEAVRRGELIKTARDRHASVGEACKLIESFGQAEMRMIKYVETHSAQCGVLVQVADQLKNGHKNTENMLQKVCAAAQQAQARGPAGPSLSEVLGSATALPEATPAKKGGSAFDTLTGNVLTR
jgi:hypothetical protein